MAKEILIVEDEEDILELISIILKNIIDYAIFCARSGEEALNIARAHVPDIILLDIQLPGLNGYEVCKLLKSESATSHSKVLMLSGMSQQVDQLKAWEVGADDYITKPFSSTILIEKVVALLVGG